ncbi:hypothetical protein WDA79_06140 [Streptomyces sp. A475]
MNRHTWSISAVTLLAAALTFFTVPAQATQSPQSAGATHAASPANELISTHRAPGITGSSAAAQLSARQTKAHRANHYAALQGAQGPAKSTAAAAIPRHQFWAVSPSGAPAPTGAYATHSVLPSFRTSHSPDVIYAPTLYPAGNACIENTTAYFTSKAEIWAWDWCNGQTVGKFTLMDSAFLSTYVQNGGYRVWIRQTDTTANTWEMLLYNFTTSAWDSYYTSSGQDPNNPSGTNVHGWDAFEVYSDTDPSTAQPYICADTQGLTFSASSMQQMENGVWHLLSPSDSTTYTPGIIFGCSNLTVAVVNPNYTWRVTNP